MTDEQLNKNRNEIIKKYFEYFGILNLEDDLGISISCSSPYANIYHVFSVKDGVLTHEYSISDKKLFEISKSLKIETIKRLFVDTRLKSYTQKMIAREANEINPMDFENQS